MGNRLAGAAERDRDNRLTVAVVVVVDVWPELKDMRTTHDAPAADANLHAINETNVLSGQSEAKRERRASERERMVELSDEPAGCFYLGGPRQRQPLKTKTKTETKKKKTTTAANDVTCVADNAPGLIHSYVYIVCTHAYVHTYIHR